MFVARVLFFLVITICSTKSQYAVPSVTLEALKKGGFRVYIPEIKILFRVVNDEQKIVSHHPGSINAETNTSENGFWILEFEDQLKVGDVINYWIFVNANHLGYRKDGDPLKVHRLLDSYTTLRGRCVEASTVISGGKSTCVGDVIINDDFAGPFIDSNTWTVEHRIPTYVAPHYYFNSFLNEDETRFIREKVMFLKPIALSESDLRASTVISGGKSTCVGDVIINDDFAGPFIDSNTWTVEHRIPTYVAPHYYFNSFLNEDETRFIREKVMFLKPIALSESDLRGILNLKQGCTATNNYECFYESKSSFLLPPVKSAKIVSKTTFKYGKIEIRAKLPQGDWIVPILQLEPAQRDAVSPANIIIAYSRGNKALSGSDPSIDVRSLAPNDIGSRLLVGGPTLSEGEPDERKSLVGTYQKDHLNAAFHVYSLIWTPDKIRCLLDNVEYGTVDLKRLPNIYNQEYTLSLGVAVGGVTDFPDNVVSGNDPKPWSEQDRSYLKRFSEAKPIWSKTWDGDNSALQVDYVKARAMAFCRHLLQDVLIGIKVYARPLQPPKLQQLMDTLTVKNIGAPSADPDTSTDEVAQRPSTRSRSGQLNVQNEVCFLCTEPGTRKISSYHCETMEIYNHIKAAAQSVGEWRSVGVLSSGDLIAQKAKYHAFCLVRI
ncbi:hypothetical protein FQR65_LT10640 [Abscondita terminalis]|nr:hypothetical protein FQR65_LT10640 [Abscondita terminalis]